MAISCKHYDVSINIQSISMQIIGGIHSNIRVFSMSVVCLFLLICDPLIMLSGPGHFTPGMVHNFPKAVGV